MRFPRTVPGLICLLLLAGCGGSGGTSSTSPTTTVSTSSTTTVSASSTTTVSRSPTTTASTRKTTNPKPAAGSASTSPPAPSGARIPATYKISSGGTLSPATISAPSGFTVAVTLANRDSRAHTVVIKTPPPSATLHVPVRGYSYLLEKKLPNGTYPITVDGATRGALVIGSAPGP